jgi:Uroporphyrinogen-III decarboxylase
LVIEPYKVILNELREVNAKKICFPRGIGDKYKEFCKLDFDIYALDYTSEISIAADIHKNYGKITQGNLDPAILYAKDKNVIAKEIDKILNATKEIPHIFNLGHGIMPETPIDNVEYMIDYIRKERG